MSIPSPDSHVLARLGVAAYDLPTRDKLPLVRELMAVAGDGVALDVGSGTGYTTHAVFGGRLTVCVDLHLPNLRFYRDRVASVPGVTPPLCVVAQAVALPFRPGSFRFVLCSEVLEHLEDDEGAVAELARVLAADGRLVVTVPYTGFGFTSFLELVRIKTVHDFPGPERHVRPGYDERALRRLFGRRRLELTRHGYYLRFFTRLAVDLVSAAHLVYQRVRHRRRAWAWSDAAAAEGTLAFRLYTWVFGGLLLVSRLDRLIPRTRGFGLIAVAKPRPVGAEGAGAPEPVAAKGSS